MNEKENTARILSSKQPLITSWKCYLNWHSWTQWSEPTYLQLEFITRQTRSCVNCNLVETLSR